MTVGGLSTRFAATEAEATEGTEATAAATGGILASFASEQLGREATACYKQSNHENLPLSGSKIKIGMNLLLKMLAPAGSIHR